MRAAAVRSLTDWEAPEAYPALVAATADPASLVRHLAILGLGARRPLRPEGQRVLIDALKDRVAAVRVGAARALVEHGATPPIAEALRGLRADEDIQVRQAARAEVR